MSRASVGALAALGLSCVTAKPTHLPLPKERASECRQLCSELEMRLAAVVVIMNAAGCVCEPTDATSSARAGAAAVGGAAAIAASQADRTRQQQ